MKHLSSNVYATILCLYKIRNDHFVQLYHAVAISFVNRTISRHAAHVAVSFVSRYRSSTEQFRDMQLMSLYRLCRDIVNPPNNFTTCSSCRCIVCVAISFGYL